MYGEELRRACAENSFAVASYELGHATPTKAEAVITTLERKRLEVELTDAGFKLLGASTQIFDTLDSLLLNSSPLAMVKTNEQLEAKLREFIQSQGDQDPPVSS